MGLILALKRLAVTVQATTAKTSRVVIVADFIAAMLVLWYENSC